MILRHQQMISFQIDCATYDAIRMNKKNIQYTYTTKKTFPWEWLCIRLAFVHITHTDGYKFDPNVNGIEMFLMDSKQKHFFSSFRSTTFRFQPILTTRRFPFIRLDFDRLTNLSLSCSGWLLYFRITTQRPFDDSLKCSECD